MVFNSYPFLYFILIFYVVYFFFVTNRQEKVWLITLSSLIFYGFWNYKYVFLLLATGLFDFYIAQRIFAETDRRRRKLLLTASVSMNLGVLAIFKYSNFFIDNTNWLLDRLGLSGAIPTLSIVLPIGVSFYTFQSISYTVDVYRGTFRPRKRAHEFLASLTFFPHLVAGPIVRSSFLVPQFETLDPPRWDACRRGFLLVAVGLLKKVVGDLLGGVVDGTFDHMHPLGSLEAWTAALAFAGQIYGDFSGYTDIAIGVAALLGFTLPQNFEVPYFAPSPVAFWHRWHITFSTWLRDYLWAPLSIAYPKRPLVVLIVTMLLAGFWHGANWTFLVFGLYHGVLLAVNHRIVRSRTAPGDAPVHAPSSPLRRALGILLTFYLVLLGWVLFRASTLENALDVLRAMHLPAAPSHFEYGPTMMLVAAVFALVFFHLLDWLILRRYKTIERPWVLWPTIVVCFALATILGGSGRLFLYFQF